MRTLYESDEGTLFGNVFVCLVITPEHTQRCSSQISPCFTAVTNTQVVGWATGQPSQGEGGNVVSHKAACFPLLLYILPTIRGVT
jgi:hypothetical protein